MEGNINYNMNPVLMWNLTNVGVKYDENGNLRPVKSVNQRACIDGAIALIAAYTVHINNMEDYMNMI
jgi:phage terminase large subunit-like protein